MNLQTPFSRLFPDHCILRLLWGISYGCDTVDWNDPAQDAVQWKTLVNTNMSLRVPRKAGKCLNN